MKCAECADRWKCGAGYDLRRKRRSCEKAKKPAKRSNADRLRSMTDEELAKWRSRGQCPTGHYHGDYDCMNRSCKDCWLEWLKENDET